jgi:predicted NAD-dependent protein-ADP-ribosyltransferase YbiA (DUF1768 family)
MSLQELSDSVNRLALQIQHLTARLDTVLLAKDAPVAKKPKRKCAPAAEGVIRVASTTKNTPYSKLSPLYKAEFTIDDKIYKTVEHYVQAAKYETTKPDLEAQLLQMDKAQLLRMTGSAKKYAEFVDPEYDIRLAYCQGFVAQLRQNKDLRSLLESTGEAFIESESTDPVLGVGVDGEGENIIGNALRATRWWLETHYS